MEDLVKEIAQREPVGALMMSAAKYFEIISASTSQPEITHVAGGVRISTKPDILGVKVILTDDIALEDGSMIPVSSDEVSRLVDSDFQPGLL